MRKTNNKRLLYDRFLAAVYATVVCPDALLSPGDFGMDPLNLTSNPTKKARFELCEIQHCRLAMMAISGIATQAVLNGGAFPYTG